VKGAPQPAPRHSTLVAAVLAAEDHPSGVTFVDLREREEWLSWGQVAGRARRAAATLASRGVAPGDRIAIVLRTEPGFLDAFFGAWLCGAVPVPLYPPVRLGRLDEYLAGTARMMSLCGAKMVVAGGSVRRILGEAVARARPELGCLDAAELLAGREELVLQADPRSLALVQFSSGSTVEPKPVALTHSALATQIDALMVLIEPNRSDCLVSWLPLYHDMGLIGCLLGAVSYPGPLVLIPPESFLVRPALWLRALARHRGTISAAPHFAYGYTESRVRDADLEGCDLSCWRMALDGAEPVTAPSLRRFAARFSRFGFEASALRPVYGLSEASLAVTFTPPGRPLRTASVDPVSLAERGEVEPGAVEAVSVGLPIPGAEVELRDRRGRPLPEDRLGRIHVRGSSMMQGYLGDPEGTRRSLQDGWLDTGDLGFVHQGEIYLYGRAKDLVIVRGANHAPEEFESCLEGTEGLRAGCAVAVGMVGEGGEEQLVILAERARGRPAVEDRILQERIERAVLERTGVRPGTVRILPPGALPRTSSGKLRRGEALRRLVAGQLDAPRSAGMLALLARMARSTLALARARMGSTG
jgi:fatty-acyl-CoA synthase